MWYKFISFRLLPILLFLALVSCQKDAQNNTDSTNNSTISKAGTHFELVKNSGISFANNLTEDVDQNYLNFEYIYNGGGVAVGDINNDGLSDIYFTGNEVPNQLYLNKGNFKFENITEKAGVAADNGWYTGVSMVDINNDGWLDIYVCKSDWRKKVKTDKRNLLYVNQKDGTFKEQANEYRLAENGYSIQASFFDYDNDGDLDVTLPIILWNLRPLFLTGKRRWQIPLRICEINCIAIMEKRLQKWVKKRVLSIMPMASVLLLLILMATAGRTSM